MRLLNKFDFHRYATLVFTTLFIFIFYFIFFNASFDIPEAYFYDFRVKTDIWNKANDSIVLISYDEISDEILGEAYPYSYKSNVTMLKNLIKEKPSAIIFLAKLNTIHDKDEYEELELLIENYKKNGGIFRFKKYKRNDQLIKEIGLSPDIILENVTEFSRDQVVRKAAINISGEESIDYWLVKELNRKIVIKGMEYNSKSDLTSVFFRYDSNPISYNSVPFHKVYLGNQKNNFFKKKIVLIGSIYQSNINDFVKTPFEKKIITPKLNIHKAIINSLLKNNTLKKVDKYVSYIIAIVFIILISYLIAKVNPFTSLVCTFISILTILIISYNLFVFFNIFLYTSNITLTIFIAYYIWVPFKATREYERRYAIEEESKILKEVEHLKQNFISLMSHDLKTPIAKIYGMADLMLKQSNYSNKHGEQSLVKIIDSTNDLNELLSSILDLTKIDTSNFKLSLEGHDINDLINSVVNSLKYEADQKDISIELMLDDLYPIEIDVRLMTRVVFNLISNAIKYSKNGKKIKIKTTEVDGFIIINVIDQGIGVSENEISRIFEKFYRVKNNDVYKTKGSGLGLYLVKYFVELHSGEVRLESTFGSGSNFIIKLKTS